MKMKARDYLSNKRHSKNTIYKSCHSMSLPNRMNKLRPFIEKKCLFHISFLFTHITKLDQSEYFLHSLASKIKFGLFYQIYDVGFFTQGGNDSFRAAPIG